MGNTATMEGVDSVSGSLAQCYITLSGRRYNFMQLINFESKMENKVSSIPILGKTGKGHKPAGWEGTWSGKAHYNQSIMRKMLKEYKKTGKMESFIIQVTNEDPTSTVGRQTIVHYGCLFSGGTLAKFDANAEYLDEDLSGTFEDWDMPEEFNLLPGMA